MLTIAIPRGTTALGKDGKRLRSLKIAVAESSPPPPEDIYMIGLAYDFEPGGASFDPPMSLTWSYDEADIPEGVAEKDLVIAYYMGYGELGGDKPLPYGDEEAGEWVSLICAVDTENNVITASVPHFTTFAIIDAITLPPPPPPAAFAPSSLSISPSEVYVGEMVTISVSLANTGGSPASIRLHLK